MQKNIFLHESSQRTEQLRRQKLMKERRDNEAKCKRDTRQYIKIGKLVCKYFPSLLEYQSADGKDDSWKLDFLEYFLELHHNNPEIIYKMWDKFEHQDL